MVVRQSTAIPKIAKIYADADLATLQAWQAFHTIDNAAPLLSRAFVDAHYEFRAKFLSGQPEQRERWKRGVAFAEGTMGEAIGRDYVKLYFPAEAKAKMDELVANVKVAMGTRLDALAWMGDATRAEAKAKLMRLRSEDRPPGEMARLQRPDRGHAATCSATRSARSASSGTTAARASASRWTRASGA